MSEPESPAESLNRVRTVVITAVRSGTHGLEALARVGQVCVELLPVDGASIAVIGGTQRREMLYASDEVSARIEALQFSLGEGPCYEAFNAHRPVLVPDLAAASTLSWPVFAAEIVDQPVAAIFAFPLLNGVTSIGVLDLYRREPGWLSPAEVTIALQVVDIATLALLALRTDPVEGEWTIALSRYREQVHQATGMLVAAHGVSAEQALALLRAHAFATGRLVDDIAGDLVSRRLSPFDLEA